MKKRPKFKTEVEERRFWLNHDSTEYIDWSGAKEVNLSKLKPTTRTISVRLPESMLEAMKLLANKRDVPYQSLLKVFLSERIKAELYQASGVTGVTPGGFAGSDLDVILTATRRHAAGGCKKR